LLIQKNDILRRFFDGRWIHLVTLEPEEGTFYYYVPRDGWKAVSQPGSRTPYERALEQQDDQEDATIHSLVSNKEGARHEGLQASSDEGDEDDRRTRTPEVRQ